MQLNIAKQKYSIGNILSHSWELFTKNFKLILAIALIVYIPLYLIVEIFSQFLGAGFVRSAGFGQDYSATAAAFGFSTFILVVITLIIELIAIMAIIYAINQRINKKNINYKEALQKSLSRLGPAVWTNIVLFVFLLGLFILLIVPGIIFSIYWAFANYAVILHNKSGKNALDHSKSIVKGRWWRVFGILIVIAILSGLASIALTNILSLIPKNFILNIIANTVLRVLMTFFTIVGTVLFINLDKVRVSKTKQ